MCGRFVSPSVADAERNFTIHLLLSPWQPSFNLAPSQQAPVIFRRDSQNLATVMRFGLVPYFAKGVPLKAAMINARVETLTANSSWRGCWERRQRCLVLSSGFYEWHLLPDGKSKQPYFIQPADQDVFAYAGLWDRSRRADGTVLESFAIITLPASPLMAQIHNAKQREPAILTREDHDSWLGGSAEQAHAALRQYPDNLLAAHPVGRRVNSPDNNDVELIAAVPIAS